MQQRVLGATGVSLSVIGFGGILCTNTTAAESEAIVREALDLGVNYFDVAPGYGDAEIMLGPALAPHRDRVFLACKTGRRDRAGADEELRRSLARLHTDHFDLYQLHGLVSPEEVEQAFGPDGAVEALVAARDAGLVRWLGFSAHTEQAALTALERFAFDSVLFPTNYFAAATGFGPRVFAAARERGLGHLALKTLAQGLWHEGEARSWSKTWYQPLTDPAVVRAAVRWTLAQGVTACASPGHPELLRLAVAGTADLQPPTPDDLALLDALVGQRPPVFAA